MPLLGKCRTCGQEIAMETESKASRGFLEGAVMTAYASWQYGIDIRDPKTHSQCRSAFKRDFCFDIVPNRDGEPVRIEASTRLRAKALLEVYTRYAEENGAPIPNPELYKVWREEWSMDSRYPTYFHFLDFLGLQVDSMPTDQTIARLHKKVEYPKHEGDVDFG